MTLLSLLALLPLACTAPPADAPGSAGLEHEHAEATLHRDTVALREATEEVRAGLAHASAGRAQDAVAAYTRAARRVPRLAAWSQALSAAALARTGDTTGVRRHLAQTDTIIARDWGWRARIDAALAAGDTLGGARLAAATAAALPDTARRVQAWARAGGIHLRAGRAAEAAPLLRRAIDESIAAPAAVEAARLLATIPQPSVEDRLRIGRVYLRHRNASRAAEAYDAWIAVTQPAAAERARIALELGRAFFDARDYASAERRLRAAAAAGVPRETTADALFMLGRTQYRQARNSDARATMLRVTRDHAGTTAAARAHFIIADIDHDAGNIESAKTHYRAVIQASGPDVQLAAARLGGLALLERRPRDAAAVFRDAHARANGTTRQQPGYWWAHALELAGARDSARAILAEVRSLDPFSYYGLRAGERLNAPVWDFAVREPGGVTSVLRGEIVARVDVVDVLRAVELNDAADMEAARLITDYGSLDGALYTLAEAYHAREQTFNGIRIGRELLRREGGWNRSLLELVYPFPYRDDVVRYARANNLDPFLVAGLIRQESMFNARARSAVGALGLMQVMPQTGAAVARTLGITGFRTTRLTEPTLNIRIGTRFLADQIRRHDGRLDDAIAAYNAGPERVVRWRRYPEYAEPEIFIERIPFQETRDYVKIVRQNARIYRELYGGS